MDKNELSKYNELYNNLLKDEDFQKVVEELKKPNLFKILGVEHREIRHSNFLAWLLNPEESHGLGVAFLKRFLSRLDVEVTESSKVEIRREWKHIDILIILEDVVVCIENKIWSEEHSNQLQRYKKIIEAEFQEPKYDHKFIYLTIEGDEPSEPCYQPMSYSKVAKILEKIAEEDMGTGLEKEKVGNYIEDYVTIVKRYITQDDKDELIELSKEIYKNEGHKTFLNCHRYFFHCIDESGESSKIHQIHRNAADFIYSVAPNIINAMKDELETGDYDAWLVTKDHVKFLPTPEFEEIRGKDKPPFCFGIYIHNLDSDREIVFQIEILPEGGQALRELIRDMEIEGADNAKGVSAKTTWRVIKRCKITNKDEDELKEWVNRFYEKTIKPTVQRIEEDLKKNS
jgi:hypothetical protein